jgi:U3 small nucleolar RNA-associated protein 4
LGDGGIVGSTLYAGLADGTIRKFESSSNVKSSRIIGAGVAEEVVQDQGAWITKDYSTSVQWTSTLRITVENRGRSVPTKIWALKALNDHTVISGDSLGHVQFWDGILGTLIQSFEHSKTDVLDLAVSQDQTKVMACGIDPTIICIGRDSEDSAAPGRVCKRVITGVMRRHSHDVHSLVTVFQTDPSGCAGISTTSNGRGKEIRELLYSGGADTKICSYFVGDIRKYRPRIVYKYPPVQNISLARIPRVFTIMRSDRIDFYKLADKSMKPKKMTHSKVMNDMNSSIGSVVFSSIHNLACCDISDDGSILAVGNAAGLALFSIDYPLEGGVVSKPVKICDPMNFSCTAIKHIPGLNRRFACCTNQGDIRIIKIDVAKDDSTGTQLEAHQESFIVDDKYRESCWSHLALSADGRWLAVANYTTGSGIINIYSLVKGCKHWWTLPLTETPISCMKFLGGNKTCPVLFVGCNNYAFYIYDVERQSLSDFSQDLGFPVSPLLPIELNHRMECPHYVTQNPSKINQFLMVSVMCVNLSLHFERKIVIPSKSCRYFVRACQFC